MSDLHDPTSPTSFDALMGDPRAVGLFGNPTLRDADAVRFTKHSFGESAGRPLTSRAKFLLLVWCAAIFVISAAVSPYIFN